MAGVIIVYDADKVARTSRYLRLDGDNILRSHHAVIGTLTGSGAGLTDLRDINIVGTVKGLSLEYGRGLESFNE